MDKHTANLTTNPRLLRWIGFTINLRAASQYALHLLNEADAQELARIADVLIEAASQSEPTLELEGVLL